MKAVFLFLASLACLASARETLPLPKWSFHLGDTPTASATGFDDSSWEPVTIPHDWAWEAGPTPNGPQLDGGGYRIGGIGWYRNRFTLPADWKGKHVSIHFDGAYRDSTVWLNGHELGNRPYGFISFQYDLNSHLQAGENTIAIRLDNSREPSTRWYHPCGLFAPVRLEATHPTSRFTHDGVIVTTPTISRNSATVHVSAEITGPAKLKARIDILDPNGKVLATNTVPAAAEISTDLTLKNPVLWSTESPVLHTTRLTLLEGNTSLDSVDISFGIRSIHWNTNTGFSLNGKVTKLKGVCEHLAGGPVGGAWPEPLIEWKLRLLKSMGCNAIRTSHNPQVPAFYDLCDKIGILVMDEIFDGWKRKAAQDYGALHFDKWWRTDLTAWIRRDRNHPCIIIWSVGNETSGPVAPELVKLCHQLDTTRPVTSGHSGSQAMDVYGVNGHSEAKRFYTEKRPSKPFVATEAPHTWQVRGFYKSKTWYRDGFPNPRQDPFETPNLTEKEIFTNAFLARADMNNRKQIFNSSYDNAYVRINARQAWEKTRDLPWYSGHFRWTGFDYPGEAGYVHGGWPFHAFAGGALDLAGFQKDLYYLYRSQWTNKPMVHLLPHWTHPRMSPGTEIPVQTYSNAEEVELLLNGKSLGIRRPGRTWDKMLCQWMVPWTPGAITAIARQGGKEVACSEHHTSAAPTSLKIEGDTSYPGYPIITLTTTDSAGHPYPYGENRIFAAINGKSRILSFENGHPADTDPPVSTNRRAFMGLARVFLQGDDSTLTFGSILGERRQLTSKFVAIDVHRVKADGTPVPTEFAIHYTLDGSIPDTKSQRFSKPFEVPSTCTVKAIALINGKPALTLQESFGPRLGLHWASADEIAAVEASSAGLEAETAKFKKAKVTSKGKGFSGRGYLDFKNKEDTIEFYQENDGPAGKANLAIRYSNADPKRKRPMDVILNGKKIATIQFPKTGSWTNDWKTVHVSCRVKTGANTLILKTTGESGPNLDQIEFK